MPTKTIPEDPLLHKTGPAESFRDSHDQFPQVGDKTWGTSRLGAEELCCVIFPRFLKTDVTTSTMRRFFFLT